MKHLLIASHGPLSKALLESATLIAGEQNISGIHHISIDLSSSHNEIISKVNDMLSSIPENDEILALTDVYGGSITTILTEYIDFRKLDIITGVNLGMLLEALFIKDTLEMSALVEYLMDTGKNGIRHVNADLSGKGGEEI